MVNIFLMLITVLYIYGNFNSTNFIHASSQNTSNNRELLSYYEDNLYVDLQNNNPNSYSSSCNESNMITSLNYQNQSPCNYYPLNHSNHVSTSNLLTYNTTDRFLHNNAPGYLNFDDFKYRYNNEFCLSNNFNSSNFQSLSNNIKRNFKTAYDQETSYFNYAEGNTEIQTSYADKYIQNTPGNDSLCNLDQKLYVDYRTSDLQTNFSQIKYCNHDENISHLNYANNNKNLVYSDTNYLCNYGNNNRYFSHVYVDDENVHNRCEKHEYIKNDNIKNFSNEILAQRSFSNNIKHTEINKIKNFSVESSKPNYDFADAKYENIIAQNIPIANNYEKSTNFEANLNSSYFLHHKNNESSNVSCMIDDFNQNHTDVTTDASSKISHTNTENTNLYFDKFDNIDIIDSEKSIQGNYRNFTYCNISNQANSLTDVATDNNRSQIENYCIYSTDVDNEKIKSNIIHNSDTLNIRKHKLPLFEDSSSPNKKLKIPSFSTIKKNKPFFNSYTDFICDTDSEKYNIDKNENKMVYFNDNTFNSIKSKGSGNNVIDDIKINKYVVNKNEMNNMDKLRFIEENVKNKLYYRDILLNSKGKKNYNEIKELLFFYEFLLNREGLKFNFCKECFFVINDNFFTTIDVTCVRKNHHFILCKSNNINQKDSQFHKKNINSDVSFSFDELFKKIDIHKFEPILDFLDLPLLDHNQSEKYVDYDQMVLYVKNLQVEELMHYIVDIIQMLYTKNIKRISEKNHDLLQIVLKQKVKEISYSENDVNSIICITQILYVIEKRYNKVFYNNDINDIKLYDKIIFDSFKKIVDLLKICINFTLFECEFNRVIDIYLLLRYIPYAVKHKSNTFCIKIDSFFKNIACDKLVEDMHDLSEKLNSLYEDESKNTSSGKLLAKLNVILKSTNELFDTKIIIYKKIYMIYINNATCTSNFSRFNKNFFGLIKLLNDIYLRKTVTELNITTSLEDFYNICCSDIMYRMLFYFNQSLKNDNHFNFRICIKKNLSKLLNEKRKKIKVGKKEFIEDIIRCYTMYMFFIDSLIQVEILFIKNYMRFL